MSIEDSIAIGEALLSSDIMRAGDSRRADRSMGLPIRAFHGDDDRTVLVGRSREMIEAIRAAERDLTRCRVVCSIVEERR